MWFYHLYSVYLAILRNNVKAHTENCMNESTTCNHSLNCVFHVDTGRDDQKLCLSWWDQKGPKFKPDVADLLNHLELDLNKVYPWLLQKGTSCKCHLLFFSCNVWFQNLLPGWVSPAPTIGATSATWINHESCTWILDILISRFIFPEAVLFRTIQATFPEGAWMYGFTTAPRASHHWSSWPLYVYSTLSRQRDS